MWALPSLHLGQFHCQFIMCLILQNTNLGGASLFTPLIVHLESQRTGNEIHWLAVMFPRSATGSWEDPPGQFSTRWEEGCAFLLCWPQWRQAHAWTTHLPLFVWFSAINHACLSQAPPCNPDTFPSHFKAWSWAPVSLHYLGTHFTCW